MYCQCGSNIPRKAFDLHADVECPINDITCEYQIHGCPWKGKRSEYNTSHYKECSFGVLVRENIRLQKCLQDVQCLDLYRKSDCFYVSGLSDRDTARRELVNKFSHTFMDLKFPVSYGSPDNNTLKIGGITTNSIFVVSLKDKVENNIQLDVDMEKVLVGCAMLTVK